MTLHRAYALIRVILFVSAGILAVACRDDGDDAEHQPTLYDIAEISDKTATSTVFTVYRPDASEAAVTLSAPGVSVGDIEVGTSVFLAYIPENGRPYTSGRISVERVSTINNSNLKRGTEMSLQGWDEDPVWLQSLWPAGDKVCVRLLLPYSTEPRRFVLVVDDATSDKPYPDAYLYHRRNNLQPNFNRQYYAAFNLAALWATPGIEGLTIHVANSNNPTLTTFRLANPRPQQNASGAAK